MLPRASAVMFVDLTSIETSERRCH
jgi:hypothetical protein